MDVFKSWTVSLALLFIQGCSSSQSTDAPPPSRTVFHPLTRQLDRARDVQNTVNQNAEATHKAVDSQEQ